MPTGHADVSTLWHHSITSPKGRLLNDDLVRKRGTQIKMHKTTERIKALQVDRLNRVRQDLNKLSGELETHYGSGDFVETRYQGYLNRLAEMEKRIEKIANNEIYLIPMEAPSPKKPSGKRLHSLMSLQAAVNGHRDLLKARQAEDAKKNRGS